MKRTVIVLMVCMLTAATWTAGAEAGQFDRIISAADVEKATGLAGVKQVPRDQASKFKNGDLNFVTGSDQPILMIEFRPVFVFDAMKADTGYYKKQVPGLGEEAFTSPAFDPQFSVNLRKGKYVAVVTTHIDPRDRKKTLLTLDQLISLAKLVESRM
jgi:hypothetical protein